MRYFSIISVILFLCVISGGLVFAHPGRTDSSGCHTCRTNCPSWGLSSGEYHCHNAKSLPQPKEPIHSRYGEGGTGYTVPAPEYKKEISTIQPRTENNEKNTTTETVVTWGLIGSGVIWFIKKIFFS